MRKILILFVFCCLLLCGTSRVFAVDGYSLRCDWCVAGGFWENVIRGNDRCVEYVSADLKQMAMVWAGEFRNKLTSVCGKKFNDGHVESEFNYDVVPGVDNGAKKVRVHGQAFTVCTKGKKNHIKTDFLLTARPKADNSGEWEIIDIGQIVIEGPKAKKKSKK